MYVSPYIRRRSFLVLLCGMVLTACQVFGLPIPSSSTPIPTARQLSTSQLADAYINAVLAGDRARIDQMIIGDARCSTPNSPATITRHIANYSGAEFRNITNQRFDIEGWLAYPPDSEAAQLTFEYRPNAEQPWAKAEILVVTVVVSDGSARLICDISD